MNTKDTQIISRCLEGDQLAYKHLYEKYISYCYGICIRYSVNQSDIKDVVQVIFTQVFHSLKNYDSEKSQFKTWLTHVCINNILTHRKKEGRKIQVQQLDDVKELENSFAENYTERDIDRQHILSLLKLMPPNYQIVFNMFILDGYSHEEIASKLDISIASSRVILNRARKWIKKTFVNQLSA